jgi:N-acylglucosamine 2-epimerase
MDYVKLYESALLQECEPFWTRHAPDSVYGGVFTSLDRCGQVYSTDKSVWMQGRCLWTYAALISRYGMRPEWLRITKSCREFLNAHCVDRDGRMFFMTTADGRPLRKRRYWFSESFYIIGNAEYARVAEDPATLEDARAKYDLIRSIHHDPSSDPFRITPKTYAATRASKSFANTMILLNVAHVLQRCDLERAQAYAHDADEYAAEIVRDFYHEDLRLLLENVGPDGSFIADNSDTRIVNPGHAIEGSWFLMNQALLTGDAALMQKAIQIFDDSMALGWDETYGGIYYYRDALGKPVVALEADMKLWWPICEALIASLMAFRATQNESYWNWFVKLTDYAWTHFRDAECGEWYGYLHRDGSVSHTYKGSCYKGPFHVERALMLCLDMLKSLPGQP